MKSAFAADLICWYLDSARDLPWRNTKDPYTIWLSEVMLQQTQVKTVIAYYHRFLERFPTVIDLANASEDQVLKLWEGLGYYARCRNLHKAAKIIRDQYEGVFPNTIEAVEALPGIGQSTAGAILTFAYGQRHPLLDGNVKRVLSRLYDVEMDITQAAAQKRLWQYSTELLADASDPYSFNQGIMELGATICLPKEPRCLVCPVHSHCDAAAVGSQHERPVKPKKAPTPHYHIGVGLIWDKQQPEERLFIQQRATEGLLGGLWEFPGGKQETVETLEGTVYREILEETGFKVIVGEKIASVKHAYTHFKITLHAYHCVLEDNSDTVPTLNAAIDSRWVERTELHNFAFPKANNRILEILLVD